MAFDMRRAGPYFIFAFFTGALLGCAPAEVPARAVAATPTPVSLASLPPTAAPWPTATPRPTLPPTPTLFFPAAAGNEPAAPAFIYPEATRVYLEPLPTGPTPAAESPVPAEGTTATDTPPATESPTAEPTAAMPAPTPYGAVYRGNVRLHSHSLFPLQTDQLPDYLQQGRIDLLPEAMEQVPAHVPFLFWMVAFDLSDAPEDFQMPLVIRWISYGPGGDELEMYRRQVLLTPEEGLFYSGIGNPEGTFWYRGRFAVEVLDDRGQRVLAWEFDVI